MVTVGLVSWKWSDGNGNKLLRIRHFMRRSLRMVLREERDDNHGRLFNFRPKSVRTFGRELGVMGFISEGNDGFPTQQESSKSHTPVEDFHDICSLVRMISCAEHGHPCTIATTTSRGAKALYAHVRPPVWSLWKVYEGIGGLSFGEQ